jgi:hypothetical protein
LFAGHLVVTFGAGDLVISVVHEVREDHVSPIVLEQNADGHVCFGLCPGVSHRGYDEQNDDSGRDRGVSLVEHCTGSPCEWSAFFLPVSRAFMRAAAASRVRKAAAARSVVTAA